MNRCHAKAEKLMIARERKERKDLQDSLNRARSLYECPLDDDPDDQEYFLLHS